MEQTASASTELVEAGLCSSCEAIDFDGIFGLDPSDPESYANRETSPIGRKVADLRGGPGTWSNSSCPLCRLYGVAVGHMDDRSMADKAASEETNFLLWALPAPTRGWRAKVLDPDTVARIMLRVVQEPFNFNWTKLLWPDVYLFDQNTFPVRRTETTTRRDAVRPERQPSPYAQVAGECGLIDVNALRSFLDNCTDNHAHSAICGTEQTVHDSPIRELPSFRTIDVETLCVVDPGPAPVYTALSYKWGDDAYDLSSQPFGPDGRLSDMGKLPALIRDAIKISKDLGFRYCWIDRYCIPQEDPRATEIQLGLMGEIYRRAAVTIVGASAAPYLPGVTRKLRSAALPVRVGSCNIAAGMLRYDGMRARIDSSPWSRRGWTYREGLFSRRRLYFTDAGVQYECGRMSGVEAGFAAPQPRWQIKEEDKAPWLLPVGSAEREKQLLNCLQTYSNGGLTFERDRLNAALGIFHVFEVPGAPLRHYLGTPIVLSENENLADAPSLVPVTLSGFLHGMLFDNERWNGSRRSNDFPSWSWTGWTGNISFPYWLQKYHPFSQPSDIQMAVHIASEFADGTILPWDSADNIRRLGSTLPSALSKFIHVEALTIQITLRRQGFEEIDGEDRPFEPYLIRFGNKEVIRIRDSSSFELLGDKEERRWEVLEIPGRGLIYARTSLQRQPKRPDTSITSDEHKELAESSSESSDTGIVIPLTQSGDALAIMLVDPVADDGSCDTMERFGMVMLEPEWVSFRPCRRSQSQWRRARTREKELDLWDHVRILNDLSDEEKHKGLGLPTWEEFMSFFWGAVKPERRSVRLG